MDSIGSTRHERVKIGALIAPAWKNPNAMQAKDYALLREAIKACGGTRLQPILARETDRAGVFEVVDGLHRLDACRDEGIEIVDAIVIARGTSNEDAKRIARLLQIGMNRMRGSIDLSIVIDSVREIDLATIDTGLAALSGFDDASLRALLATSSGPSDETLLGGSGGSAAPEEGPEDAAPGFELKITFDSRKALNTARKVMREAGGGDLGAGAQAIVESYKAAQKAKKGSGNGSD